MSQSTLSIANSDGRTFRLNVNAALQALGSHFYGENDPATLGYVGAGCYWADSGNNLLKQRNATNTEWITKGRLLSDGTVQFIADAVDFFNSGIAFPTANLVQGMLFFRTDLRQLFELKDLTPTWVLVFDLNKTATNKEYVDASIPAYGGNGSATTVSRSDHTHAAQVDCDTVDGKHANSTANNLLVLDGSALVPLDNIPDTIKTRTISMSAKSPGANEILGVIYIPAGRLVKEIKVYLVNAPTSGLQIQCIKTGPTTIADFTCTVSGATTFDVAPDNQLSTGTWLWINLVNGTVVNGIVTVNVVVEDN